MAVYKRGGTWYARIYWRDALKNRHSKSKGGFKTKKEANDWYANERSKHIKGLKIDKNPVFAEYFWEFYQTFKEPHVRFATKKTYKRANNILKDYWKTTKIKEIDKASWQKFLNYLSKKYARSSNVSICKQYHAAIINALNDGIIYMDFTYNTKIGGVNTKTRVDKVTFPSLKQIKQINQTAKDRRSIYLMSAKDITLHGRKVGDDKGNITDYVIMTQIMTGMRIGEALGLKWHNLHDDTIDIHHSYESDTHVLGPTKNQASYRTISINPSLVKILKELKVNGTDYVFGAKTTGLPPTRQAVENELYRILKLDSIPSEGFSSHTLRHCHVALLVGWGADIYEIRDRMGHSNIGTTLNTYGYLLSENKKSNDKLITSSLEQLM
ncbi:MAG: site-specific integrase [Lactobacillus sp.]|nr:site-specific integrase [Lactobacillus sp.]